MRRPVRGAAFALGAALAVGAAVLLVGCTAAAPAATSSSSPKPSASAGETPAPVPTLAPLLSAEQNKDYFDHIGTGVIAANGNAGGRDFIDALVAGGFDKSAMQVTPDRTAVDLQADSVQWSVLFAGKCLVGQYGPASGGYHSEVVAPTSQGTCLLGQTRPIDW